jgi:2-succinyl-5-enolpyruvyl-6-hydroxy-3-cyclohexene-1-carboxylate synthase
VTNAPNINTLWAKAFVDELARSGLRSVCISPGSRSTPLVVQFAEHPDIEDLSVVDERSAAFFALGIAQATDRPVALVCTSGTAAANYFPAVCEAASSGVPLLLLTADRPPELQDCGASQAMDQFKLFGDRVRWFHQVAQPEVTPQKLRYVRGLACRAYHRAHGSQPGPVHLNFPFRKPLEPVKVPAGHPDSVPATLADDDPVAVNGRADKRPFLGVNSGTYAPSLATIEAFEGKLRQAKRPLILAGADGRGADYRRQLCAFAERIGAPIMAEPTSGLRHMSGRGCAVIATADFLLASELYEHVGAPDLVIRTGRAPLLWSTQALVRGLKDAEQIIVGPAEHPADPDHVVSFQIQCDERALFEAACLETASSKTAAEQTASGAWLESHRSAEEVALGALRRELRAEQHLSAPRMWHELGQLLPDGAGLFVSNSMPIRNLDTFMCGARSSLDVFFNRGLNGIDGINSTGLGVAVGRRANGLDAPTVIVTGDVALRHDIGGLSLAAELEADATIIVVDNDGGAIFEYLPIAQFESVHRRHFTTPPARSMGQSTLGQDQFGQDQLGYIEVSEPDSWKAFRADVGRSLEASGTQLIRVRTDGKADKELRESVRRDVAARIDQAIREFTS